MCFALLLQDGSETIPGIDVAQFLRALPPRPEVHGVLRMQVLAQSQTFHSSPSHVSVTVTSPSPVFFTFRRFAFDVDSSNPPECFRLDFDGEGVFAWLGVEGLELCASALEVGFVFCKAQQKNTIKSVGKRVAPFCFSE